MRKLFLPLAIAALLLPAQTQKFALTIDNIMRGPGLVGYEPGQARWSGDGARIFFPEERWTEFNTLLREHWQEWGS